MFLSELKESEGLSNETIAERLNAAGLTVRRGERKGEPITADDVKRKGDRIPFDWVPVLGVERVDPFERAAENAGATETGAEGEPRRRRRRTEGTPQRPPGAPVEVVIEAGAQKRIAGAYKMVGAALATGSGSPGIAHVFADQSDMIARLWIDAAADNPYAARFVQMMSAGGPMGDLVAGHLYLAGACFYVFGAAIPGGDAIFPKYSRYRRAVIVSEPEPTAPAADNGAPVDVTAQAAVG